MDPIDVVIEGGGMRAYCIGDSLKYIFRHIGIRRIYGVSAGAVAAILCACDIDFDHWCRLYVECISPVYNQTWDLCKSFAAALDQILPADAHVICSNRVFITIHTFGFVLSSFKRQLVSEFSTRQDLIESVIASCQIPFITMMQCARKWRGQFAYDGILPIYPMRNFHDTLIIRTSYCKRIGIKETFIPGMYTADQLKSFSVHGLRELRAFLRSKQKCDIFTWAQPRQMNICHRLLSYANVLNNE